MTYIVYGLVSGVVLGWIFCKFIKNKIGAIVLALVIANGVLLVTGQIDTNFAVGSLVGAIIGGYIPQLSKKSS